MIHNLQLIRAFAAINVVFFHIIDTAEGYERPIRFLDFLADWGKNGVDLFFVISGFVMLHTQMQRKRSVADFYLSRIIRIVPIYWFMITVVLLLYALLPALFRQTTLTTDWVISSYLFVSGFYLDTLPLVNVGWTLEWEMVFYLVFGLSLLFQKWSSAYLFIFISLLLVTLWTFELIILEFFAGMLAAYIYNLKIINKTGGTLLLCLGAILLCVSLSDTVKAMEIDRAFLWGIPSFFIVLGAVTTRQLANPAMIFVGDASYSIYLVQTLSIRAFYKFVSALGIEFNHDMMSVFCLVATVLAGIAMYVLIERPTTHLLRQKIARPSSNRPLPAQS